MSVHDSVRRFTIDDLVEVVGFSYYTGQIGTINAQYSDGSYLVYFGYETSGHTFYEAIFKDWELELAA